MENINNWNKFINEESSSKSDDGHILSRKDEINMIAYKIPNSNDKILAKTENKKWVVWCDFSNIKIYSTREMEEIYSIDMIESDFERLAWPS